MAAKTDFDLAGVEVDITDRDADNLRLLRKLLDDAGFEATVL
jgi:hypothetical protein